MTSPRSFRLGRLPAKPLTDAEVRATSPPNELIHPGRLWAVGGWPG